jgi:hypothetical protein
MPIRDAMAWALTVHTDAPVHVTNEIDTRDRWIEQYGASKVIRLGPIGGGGKPFAWRYRLKGNTLWHFYENEDFDLPDPGAYEFAPLFLPSVTPGHRLEASETLDLLVSFQELTNAAKALIERDRKSRCRGWNVHADHTPAQPEEIARLEAALNKMPKESIKTLTATFRT